MEKKWWICKNVVLYLEKDRIQKFGTFHHFFTDDKAYINDDMVEVVLHVLNGETIESFFSSKDTRNSVDILVKQTQELLENLAHQGFLVNDFASSGGKIKVITTHPPLRVLFIEVTKDCNLRCKHCYVPDSRKPKRNHQLNLLELQSLIKQADEIGVMEVQLTGGELFMLPRALEIIQDLQKRLLPCSIFTNGTLLSPDLFEHLEKIHHGLIFYISLDGPARIHDEFRGVPGSFEKTVTNIYKLLKIGCDVRINTAVGSHNIKCLKEFINYVRDEFGVLHRLVEIEPIGRAKENGNLTISHQEFAKLLIECGDDFQFLDSHDRIASVDWTTPACGIGCAMMFIDAYGNASLCPTLTQEQNHEFLAGNIHQTSLKEIWETSSVFKQFRDIQCSKIETCEFRELCKGGCRSRVYLNTGDIYAPDETMCYLYSKTKNSKNKKGLIM